MLPPDRQVQAGRDGRRPLALPPMCVGSETQPMEESWRRPSLNSPRSHAACLSWLCCPGSFWPRVVRSFCLGLKHVNGGFAGAFKPMNPRTVMMSSGAVASIISLAANVWLFYDGAAGEQIISNYVIFIVSIALAAIGVPVLGAVTRSYLRKRARKSAGRLSIVKRISDGYQGCIASTQLNPKNFRVRG